MTDKIFVPVYEWDFADGLGDWTDNVRVNIEQGYDHVTVSSIEFLGYIRTIFNTEGYFHGAEGQIVKIKTLRKGNTVTGQSRYSFLYVTPDDVRYNIVKRVDGVADSTPVGEMVDLIYDFSKSDIWKTSKISGMWWDIGGEGDAFDLYSIQIGNYHNQVSDIIFPKTHYDMRTGDTVKLSPDVLPLDAYDKTLVWDSSNRNVVTVTQDGLVTARTAGKTVITAISVNGVTSQVTVEVTSAFTIQDAPQALNVGQSVQLSVEPPQDVTWLTSDERVMTVTSNGFIQAKTLGNVEISATNVKGDRDVVFIRVVSAESIRSLHISPQRVSLKVGQRLPLALTVVPSGADVQSVLWSSSHNDIISIHGTVITAIRPGTSVITVTAPNGVKDSIRVECLPSVTEEDTEPCSTEKVPVNKSWLSTDRIYAQYRTKPKAMKWFNITRQIGGELYNAIQDTRRMYDIDRMIGAQLDIIGRIVGVTRRFIYNAEVHQAMYDTSMYGDPESMYASGSIASEGAMGDDLFRLVIKAKIVRNNNGSTYNCILKTFATLFPQIYDVYITDYEDMSYEISYVAELTDLQRWALLNVNLLPKPPGVRLRGFIGIPPEYVQLGDEMKQLGDPDAQLVNVRTDEDGA